ncbi:MAG: hypothetical protein ACJ735_02110 [Actinomycetes bacterium]
MRRFVLLTVAVGLAATTIPAALAVTGKPAVAAPAVYLVGGGEQSINPTAAMLATKSFYLGGYGFSDFKAGNKVQLPGTSGRFATGILGDGVHSRALAVSDKARTIVLGQIETQGYFAAYKQGPYGINEIRKDASARIGTLAKASPGAPPVPTASQILVNSNHTHGGPDTVGVWGGVPTSYLQLVHDRTVQAIVDAWTALRPATLSYGVAHAGVVNETAQYPPTGDDDPLLTNQFSDDPNNQTMDDQIRVLQARDPGTGAVLDTYVNYSSHPTVLGSSNRGVTADYVGRLDLLMSQAFGGFAMDQVATLGREQPARADCPTGGDDSDPTAALCKLDNYAGRVVAKVQRALTVAQPLTGTPDVAMNSYLVEEPATNPVLAVADYGGTVIGAPIMRAATPPWFTGSVVGTTAFSGRIGDVLLSGGPGEMYAQIWSRIRKDVTGMRGYLSIGTAGDFLGYIIYPLTAYPEPVRRSMFSGEPPPMGDICSGVPSPVGCPDPIGNDNFFFNMSMTFGTHLTCDLLRGAGDVLANRPAKYWVSETHMCAAYAGDLALRSGSDTLFPEQPATGLG